MYLIALLALFVALLIVLTNWLKLHPFLALLFVTIGYGLLAGMPAGKVASSVTEGFGTTAGKIHTVGSLVIGVATAALIWVVSLLVL